jgi:biotin carboxylase
MNLSGKKLLVLGGLAQNLVIVERAKKLGCHVTVVDYLENSPCKKIADDNYLISITDVEAISHLCHQNGIDGVMNYCIDPGQKPYQKICEILGYPCYGQNNHFELLTNKDLFYQTCIENNVGVVTRYNVDYEKLFLYGENINFPLIVKPADGRASKGISKCESFDAIRPAIEKALSFSSRKKVVIEEFMDCPEVCAKYFVCDGEVYLTSFSDTYTGSLGRKSTAINGKYYPSKYYKQFKAQSDGKIRQMIKKIGIENGPLSFTGFFSDRGFHFFDPSYRLGGAQQWRIEAELSGVDASEALTNFALTGNCNLGNAAKRLETDFSNKIAGQLFILVREGKIKDIIGTDDALKTNGVIGHYYNHQEGDTVNQFGTTDHVVITIHMVANSKTDLLKCMKTVQDLIDVLDDEGKSMLLPKFDLSLL